MDPGSPYPREYSVALLPALRFVRDDGRVGTDEVGTDEDSNPLMLTLNVIPDGGGGRAQRPETRNP